MIDVLASLALIVLAVLLLALITDHIFIPSLDAISQRLRLSDEVAGASLMAMGSSAPELAIALIALFSGGGEHSDVGIGTIVGSAVFNILVITGVSAVVAGGLRVYLSAVTRDIAVYLAAIVYLTLVFLDGQIAPAESLAGLAGYAAYLLLLARAKAPIPESPPAAPSSKKAPRPPIPLWHRFESVTVAGLRRFTGDPRRNYLWAFALAIAMIVALSYLLVESTIVFSAAIGIPPVIVALTLLAAGTSAPDLLSSVDVALDGRGGMAVANAVGSNTFDLLIGLALPWTLALSLLGEDVIHVGTADLAVSVAILFLTTILLYVMLRVGRQLSRRDGWILLGCYGIFVLYTLLSRNVL